MIDWNLPLETDEHSPQRVRIVTRQTRPYSDGWAHPTAYTVQTDSQDRRWEVSVTGAPCLGGPSVRNVAQPTLRTSDECLQRMEALVRRMAVINECRDPFSKADDFWSEAAAIVKSLPSAPPVDPDAAEARRLCNESTYDLDDTPCRTNARIYDLVFAALKRGRELARTS